MNTHRDQISSLLQELSKRLLISLPSTVLGNE